MKKFKVTVSYTVKIPSEEQLEQMSDYPWPGSQADAIQEVLEDIEEGLIHNNVADMFNIECEEIEG